MMTEGTRATVSVWANNTAFSVMGAAAGVLLTYFTSVTAQSQDITRVSEQVVSVSAQIALLREEMRSLSTDRYRGIDASRDFKARDARIERNERDIKDLQGHQHKGGLE